MMMNNLRVTVWKDPNDLKEVRRCFFPDLYSSGFGERSGVLSQDYVHERDGHDKEGEKEERRRELQSRGTEIVMSWMARSTKTPIAIISTCDIILAQLAAHDLTSYFNNNDTNLSSSNDNVTRSYNHNAALARADRTLQSQYSQALSRCVSLYCERYAPHRDMKSAAKSIGMPEYWVELRHQIAHRIQPPLAELVTVCAEILEWLRLTFWDQLEFDGSEPPTDAPKEGDEIHLSILNSEKRQSALACFRNYLSQRKEEILRGVEGFESGAAKLAVVDLKEQLRTTGRQEDLRSQFILYMDSLLSSRLMMPKHLSDQTIANAFNVWDPFLLALVKTNTSAFYRAIIIAFLTNLTKHRRISQQTDLEAYSSYRWLCHLLALCKPTKDLELDDDDTSDGEATDTTTASDISTGRIDMEYNPWLALTSTYDQELSLQYCLAYPDTWTLHLARLILESLPSRKQQQWSTVVRAAISPFLSEQLYSSTWSPVVLKPRSHMIATPISYITPGFAKKTQSSPFVGTEVAHTSLQASLPYTTTSGAQLADIVDVESYIQAVQAELEIFKTQRTSFKPTRTETTTGWPAMNVPPVARPIGITQEGAMERYYAYLFAGLPMA